MSERPAFDPLRINWKGPDETRPERCSYCDGELPEVPLMLWNEESWAASFCDPCSEVVLSGLVVVR